MRGPNRFKQIDVARAIRAAQQTGAGAVRVLLDGTILIDPQPKHAGENHEDLVDESREVVL